MTVRPEQLGDAVGAVITSAFDDAGVAALWADVVGRGLARASLVAVDGASTIGHVGLSHGWLDTRRALVDLLVLSPLSVAPTRQRQGTGTALLAAAVAEAERLDAPLLVLEGSPGFYGARGFRPAAELGVEPASRRTPAPACQVVALPGRQAWMTGRIVYHDVWWEHDAAGLRDPDLASVEDALGVERRA